MQAELISEYKEKIEPILPAAKRANGSRKKVSPEHEASRQYTELLVEFYDKGGSLPRLAEALGVAYSGVRRRVVMNTVSVDQLNRIKRKEHQASIDTYCVTSSIAISGITFSGLFLIINNIGILLTQLIEKSISAQEPVLKKVAYEKTNLETWIERSSAELLKKVSEQNLTPEDKEELDQTIKKLAMENLIEMLEKTSNPPHDTSDTKALLNQKLMALLAKVKTEYATKENSHCTVKRKFENIARTVEDFTGMEVPLFPVLHLEAGETIFGIRELSCITSSEVRMPKDPYFQETEKDRNSLNTLIKQLLRGETGYINNRSTTSVENDPRIEAYPIQFSKELFPAFLFLSLIQKIIERIEEIEELPNSALNLQSLSRRPVAFVPQE